MQKSVVERRLALSRAIERCYDAFAHVRLPKTIDFCEHCHDPACAQRLNATPVRELDAGQVRCLAYGLIDTFGSATEVRYLVPRLFELLAAGEPNEPEIVCSKLAAGGWQDWPSPEQEAVGAFLEAWWEHVLTDFPGPTPAAEALCGIALVVDDLGAFLHAWTDDVQTAALRHMAQLIAFDIGECLNTLRPLQLLNSWWQERPEQHAQVLAWLTSLDRLTTLEAAIHVERDADVVAELTAAFEVLALALRTAPPGPSTGDDEPE